MSIICFAITRSSTGAVINSVSSGADNQKELTKIFNAVKKLELAIDQRQKISTADGEWYITLDSQAIIYLVKTLNSYPERHAYAMIQEVHTNLASKLKDNPSISDPEIKRIVDKQMKDLMTKFNDLKAIDKIYKVQENVNQTQQIVTKNIEKMFENQTAINDLERSADKLKSESFSFNKNSADLRKIMWTRNLKLKIILAILIVVILLCILIPVLSKVT